MPVLVLTDTSLVNENWRNRTFSWLFVLGALTAKVRLSHQWEMDCNLGIVYIKL